MLTRSASTITFAPKVLAPSLLALGLLAGAAHAGEIPGTTLAPVSVNGDVGISLADYAVALNAPGTKHLVGPIFIPDGPGFATPACTAAGFCNYGTGEISATLGVDPTVILSATPANNGGGDSFLDMTYQAEYTDSSLPAGTIVNPTLLVNDVLNQAGDSAAEAVMTISGPNGVIYTAFHCESGPGAAFGCGSSLPDAPFADQVLNMEANVPYTVEMDLTIYSHDPVSAEIDPIFIVPKHGAGEFIFSPGITEGGGVPEPTTWAVMLLGFLGAGAALRRTRARPAMATG